MIHWAHCSAESVAKRAAFPSGFLISKVNFLESTEEITQPSRFNVFRGRTSYFASIAKASKQTMMANEQTKKEKILGCF